MMSLFQKIDLLGMALLPRVSNFPSWCPRSAADGQYCEKLNNLAPRVHGWTNHGLTEYVHTEAALWEERLLSFES